MAPGYMVAVVDSRQKVVYVARFREDLSREEASRYWTEVHAPMADGLDGMVGYVQNHVRGAAVRDGEWPIFDGFACEWWRDRPAYDAGMATDRWQAIVDDGPEVFEVGSLRGMSVAVEESVLRAGDHGPAPEAHKQAFLMRFRTDMPRADAAHHWREVHGPLALAQPGMVRYVQNLVTGLIGEGGSIGPPQGAGFDGLAEVWFTDEDAWERAYASEAWRESLADCSNFLDMSESAGFGATVEQRVIKLPA
jgi:uncharacterized protein (TIGR02118 family)